MLKVHENEKYVADVKEKCISSKKQLFFVKKIDEVNYFLDEIRKRKSVSTKTT